MTLPDPNRNIFDARELGLSTSSSAATNKAALQQAIADLGSARSGVITASEMYPLEGPIPAGNVQIIGTVAGFKGPLPANAASPSLSATASGGGFIVTDTTNPLFVVTAHNTVLRNLTLHYPNQPITTTNPAANLIQYPATIVKDNTALVGGVRIENCCFIGCWEAIDFSGSPTYPSQDLIIDACYGYPLSGRFLKISYCYDIARITRCHVNPGQGYPLQGFLTNGVPVSGQVIDHVISSGDPTFEIQNVDEFFVDLACFVFGTRTAFRIIDSYGTLSGRADEVETGIYVTLNSGSIHKYVAIDKFNCIPGAGPTPGNRNAIVFDGSGGRLKISNCHAFCGTNAAVPSSSNTGTNSFLKVSGSGDQKVQLTNCSTSGFGWNFSKSIDLVNGSAIVNDVGSIWDGCNSVTQTTLDLAPSNVILTPKTLAIGSGNAITPLTTQSANNLISIVVDGQSYQFFAYLPSGVTATDVAIALPNIPSSRRSAVATAANTAASGQSFSAANVLTALSSLSVWLQLELASCYTDTGLTTPCSSGDPVAGVKAWVGTVNAKQLTSLNQPSATTSSGVAFNPGNNQVLFTDTASYTVQQIFTAYSTAVANPGNNSPGVFGSRTSGAAIKCAASDISLGFTQVPQKSNIISGFVADRVSQGNIDDNATNFVDYTTGITLSNSGGINVLEFAYANSSNGSKTFAIGADPFTGGGIDFRYWNGNIYSLMFSSTVLSTNDRTAINRFLMAYWGLI